jgi:hypothetical protein
MMALTHDTVEIGPTKKQWNYYLPQLMRES